MKNNKNIKKRLMILGAILLCSFLIYFFVDFIWNGTFLDWFDKNYMMSEKRFLEEVGQEVLVHSPRWDKIKSLLLIVFVSGNICLLVIILFISSLRVKKREKELVTDISKRIHSYMNEEEEASKIFPLEQTSIASLMTQIKEKLHHQENALKEELTRQNDLIAYLAHDLKTPLTSVIGYLSMLDEIDDIPKQQQEKYVSISLAKAYRLEELINELFDIARFNSEEIVLEKEELSLTLMIEQIIDDFYPVLTKTKKKIQLHAETDSKICADPDKLSRVFSNLINNAINYSQEKSTIVIKIRKEDHTIKVEIINKGTKISKEKLEHIFEKFYRIDASRTSNTGGSGLGLAIAKEIVTLHNGTITATSNEEETTFSITLPLK